MRPEMAQWPWLVRLNQSLQECIRDRWACRAELLEAARDYTRSHLGLPCASPRRMGIMIVTGHQAIWHHCGIWSKTLACSEFGRVVHGTALHVVLDHDVCDTVLRVPQSNPDGTWHLRSLRIERGPQNTPLESRRAQAARVEQFIHNVARVHSEQVCHASWNAHDAVEAIRSRRLASVPDVITYLQATLNASLGLDNLLYLPVSRLSGTHAFLEFAVSIMSHAMYFSQCYNHAVAERSYGSRRAGRTRIRPLALDSTRGQAELPFWLVRADGSRISLHVRYQPAGVTILAAGSSELGRLEAGSLQSRARQLGQLLKTLQWLLRPKAIALTLFLRLYLADWFIHGLGGATYEPITDYLIRNYYGARPPHYGVLTCTMVLPRCSRRGPTHDPGRLRHLLHHLKHNPEQCLDAPEARNDRAGLLVRRKHRQIARAGDPLLSRSQRKAAWRCISLINRQLRECADERIAHLHGMIIQAQREQTSRTVLQSREYFYGLFPQRQLRHLRDAMTFSEPVATARACEDNEPVTGCRGERVPRKDIGTGDP